MASIFDVITTATSDGDAHAWSLPNIRGQGRERWIGSHDPDKLDRWAKRNDADGNGQFFCVSTIEHRKPRKKENARQIPFVFADVDLKDLDLTQDEVERRLRTLDLEPSRIHFTGGGFHTFWLLDQAVELPDEQERIEPLLKRIADMLGADPQVAQIVSLLRVPGTHNSKKGAWTEVKVIHETAATYSLDQIEDWLDSLREPVMIRRGKQTDPFTQYADGRSQFKPAVDWEARLEAMEFEGEGDHGVHATHLSVTASMVTAGVPEDEIVSFIMEHTRNLTGTEGWDWREEERALRRMVQDWERKLQAKGKEPAPVSLAEAQKSRKEKKQREVESSKLPVIKVHPGELPKLAKHAEELLIQSGAAIYARGGMLVRPIIETADASHGRKTKVARLVAIVPVYLRNRLGQIARWQRYDKRAKDYHPIDVPSEVAPIILASEGEWKFPSIAGVVTTPTMRPDGTILDKQGYDEATRLLLVEPPPMPPIREAPTKADAVAALGLLEDLLAEFPFVDDVAKSVALSALITPVVRGAFSVAPMHVTRAPVASSGKSYLNDLVAAIAIGQLMPVMAAGRTEEETEKRLGAALLTGQPLISIDNVNGELGGDFLCQAIERPIVEVRILGKSERVRIEARGTSIFGTGNNIVVVGDLCRRVVTATLNPGVERPELREFTGNPVATVMADRGAYIAAALTVCRAYVAAGRPNRAKRLASFEGWSDTVRSALMWLGKADPIASMEIARADDPELTELRDVITAWADTIGVGRRYRITLSDLLEIAEERLPMGNFEWPELNAALSAVSRGRRNENSGRTLGLWARGRKDRIVDGLYLTGSRTSDSGNAQTFWWVEGPEQPGRWNGNTTGGEA